MLETSLEKAQHPDGSSLELAGLEASLAERVDFSTTFVAVCELRNALHTHPEAARVSTVASLARVLKSREHAFQKQSRFLYREAADGLAFLLSHDGVEHMVAMAALTALQRAAARSGGNARRAAAEALGSLPFQVQGPQLRIDQLREVPHITWSKLLKQVGADLGSVPTISGRSLLVPFEGEQTLLTVKMARAGESREPLQCESIWMRHIAAEDYACGTRFDIPNPVLIEGSPLVRLKDPPVCERFRGSLHHEGYALCFIAHRDYFTYVNDHRPESRPAPANFREALQRNAWLLGRTAGRGVVHCAPIPLFHNRVQADRRPDSGLYEWPRGGRLDRWLDSCRYPNLGLTGLRDFEHFHSFKGSGRMLYHHVGAHILSLLLVAGSYFRNKNPRLVGFAEDGKPMDARGLFDRNQLQELVDGIFMSYFSGFTGRAFQGNRHFDSVTLVERMIEEMGVDRYMEEILRVPDQERMTDDEFRHFLSDRGISGERLASHQRGAGEIVMHTGPHLGAFNSRISIPELIEYTATAAALCIGARFCDERFAGGPPAGDFEHGPSSPRNFTVVPFRN